MSAHVDMSTAHVPAWRRVLGSDLGSVAENPSPEPPSKRVKFSPIEVVRTSEPDDVSSKSTKNASEKSSPTPLQSILTHSKATKLRQAADVTVPLSAPAATISDQSQDIASLDTETTSRSPKKTKKRSSDAHTSSPATPSISNKETAGPGAGAVQGNESVADRNPLDIEDINESLARDERKAHKRAIRDARRDQSKTSSSDKPWLRYLHTFQTDRAAWKFNKSHQTALLKTIFKTHAIPSSYDSAIHKYLKGLQSPGAAEQTFTVARSILEATPSPSGESLEMDRPEHRQKVFEAAAARDAEIAKTKLQGTPTWHRSNAYAPPSDTDSDLAGESKEEKEQRETWERASVVYAALWDLMNKISGRKDLHTRIVAQKAPSKAELALIKTTIPLTPANGTRGIAEDSSNRAKRRRDDGEEQDERQEDKDRVNSKKRVRGRKKRTLDEEVQVSSDSSDPESD